MTKPTYDEVVEALSELVAISDKIGEIPFSADAMLDEALEEETTLVNKARSIVARAREGA